ncbi:MAG: phosphohydrolase [Rhodothermaceae bacterium]|uniref:phosphohydrolase n=1 Tax=Rhodocaloribacter litoris TaxID=2558931 RepID=UPI001E2B4943|nr:phosphohydrolase [Rhodocaloribacter litoris]GIV59694.1 MAG: phosphohydrolase [Rhodothermaceae bacterium]
METSSKATTRRFPDWETPSPKEAELNRALLERTSGKVHRLLQGLLVDREVNLYHSYANAVSVRRLGYNDHGPVHARITTYNALKLLRLLRESGIRPSLEEEEVGTYEDAQVAVALGCFLHDLGMGVTRENHEWHSIVLADGIITRYLTMLYGETDPMRVVVRAMAHEVIVGHMGHSRIHSVEAGVVLVADGTDMARGRSRIPQIIDRGPVVGDIHRYSASAISRVDLSPGDAKPVRITISMENKTGLFQVEEILMGKVKASPIMPYLEICALVADEPPRFYLR